MASGSGNQIEKMVTTPMAVGVPLYFANMKSSGGRLEGADYIAEEQLFQSFY